MTRHPARASLLGLCLALAVGRAVSADPLATWSEGAPEGVAELAPGVVVAAGAHSGAACHGWDGSGGGEGAMRAPDLGRQALTARGYDAATFAAAIARGTAPDGRVLSRAMPRFDLPATTLAAIWDLTVPLEARRRHGVTPDRIHIAILHDPDEPTSAALARAYLEALNRTGGPLWGRRLVFTAEPADHAAALADDPGVFAVIGPFAPGLGPRRALAAGQVPMLHGFGAFKAPAVPVLALGRDRLEEVEALLRAAQETGHDAVEVVGGEATSREDALRLIRRLGLQTTEGAGRTAYLVLSPEAQVADGLTLLVPEAVFIARSELAAAIDLITVSTLPFLSGVADPTQVYAETSLRVILGAIQDAGPDPTRRSVSDAARRVRDALLDET